MWEKFKNSNFAVKFKEGWKRGGALVTVFCLILALAVVLSVSIATNRAKKKYGGEDTTDRIEDNTDRNNGGNSGNQNGGNSGNQNGGNSGSQSGNNGQDKPSSGEEDTKPVGGEVEEFELALPVNGVISKGHDASIQVWSNTMEDYRVHLGIDIVAAEGETVYASADGEVSKVWDDPLMGRCVAISHGDNICTVYKNLNATLAEGIKQGAKLKAGDEIGCIGETAIAELADEPHLHLEMTVNGLAVDPREYLSDEAKQTLSTDTSYEQSVNAENAADTAASGK